MSLPAWGKADLPEPLPFSFRNALKTIGPGAILLSASIGGGEWLVGPAVAVQYGPGLFWIATVAIVLQTLFNLEAIRYTLYTGEPALSGVMRLKPGSKFWAAVYVILTLAQLGLPALAAACSSVLFASFMGRMPGAPDGDALRWVTYGLILVTAGILLCGKTIERMLEVASWFMIAYIFTFLIFVNVFFVPFSNWMRTAGGFFEFGYLPEGADMVLLAALAATAGSGGIGNLGISNWVRDKGFGMGATVGAIASAFGSTEVKLSQVGNVFPVTDDNLRRWKLWWKYVEADQVWLWGLGCFAGMYLNVNLATGIIPHGTDIAKVGAGAFQAQYMSERLWSGFWFLALLNGFWILFSTHLGNTDTLIRTVTDVLWTAAKPTQTVSRLYYTLLFTFTAWALMAVNWGTAMELFKGLAAVAGPVLGMAAIQLLMVNTKLLPEQLRPPMWRRAALLACSAFYIVMSIAVVRSQLK